MHLRDILITARTARLAWNDDSQVAILYVAKWVGEPGQVPGATVTIEAIE